MSHELSSLSFAVQATGADLHLCAKLNGKIFFDQDLPLEEIEVSHEFAEVDDTKHTIEIILSGKLPGHTVIDADGNILQDRLVEIKNFSLDDIELQQMFNELARYHHDFNGSQDPVVDSFHGFMGCNGTVKFEFTSPLYVWLLENM